MPTKPMDKILIVADNLPLIGGVGANIKTKKMKQIRFVEETNGQIVSSQSGIRSKGRDVFEDKLDYRPTYKEPRVYTIVMDYSGNVRRKGKWDRDKVLENYPSAKGYLYKDCITDKVISFRVFQDFDRIQVTKIKNKLTKKEIFR